MKIAILLCSLATFAIAVPVYQKNVIESSHSTQPTNIKRVRKSALIDVTSGILPEHGIEKIPIHSSQKWSPGTFVEAKSFRRPIIIKRKLGYHVYRDSDEEMAHAEPGEKCREQVKFKLCDHEPVPSSKNGIKNPTFKCVDNYKTDNEMENSIKMAKEAVEYLQRDLKRMENFSTKMVQPHIEDIESKTALHHDIEIAREALEHIESVNAEVNKVNELQIPKSEDEERLVRWREAIENINKNYEIVKNIEDGFKSDNHFSLFRPDSRKAVGLGKPEFINDNLEYNIEGYDKSITLKSASNEIGIAQLSPKTENVEKDIRFDVFFSPIKNGEENVQLHSDSLISVINSEDTALRSDVSEKESTKYDDNVSKESREYTPKNSNSLPEMPKYNEHERTMNDHISDHYELLPKVSISSSDALQENVKIEEQKTIAKSALPDAVNRNRLIHMKSVKEILENKKDQGKSATNNEENINEDEERFFKTNNDNSPLERLSSMPKPTIIEASENPETGGEKKKYVAQNNNKVVEDNEKKIDNTNMRLSYDQEKETEQLSGDNSVTIDQDNTQSPDFLSLKEKNVFSGEENVQNEDKTHYTMKENHQFYDSLKDSEQEVQDEPQSFKYNDEHKNMKSSEVQGEQIGLRMIQNQELNKFSFLNDDSVITVDHKEPEQYKTVFEASNEHILKDRDQSANQHSKEEEMSSTIHRKDRNDDRKWQYSKSVPEMPSDPKAAMPMENVDITEDQQSHKEEASMRSAESQNENVELSVSQEVQDPSLMRLDIQNYPEDRTWPVMKSVPELHSDSMVLTPADKVDITDEQNSHRKEANMRSGKGQNEKIQLNENQEEHEPMSMGLDIERQPKESKPQLYKSVSEWPYDPLLSTLTEKVDITDNSDPRNVEASVSSTESQNEKLKLNEYQEEPEHSSRILDIENNSDDAISQFLKSVPELQLYPTASLATVKTAVTNDQQSYGEEASMRLSESQNEKLQLNDYQEQPEHASTRLDIDNNSDDTTSQFLKSVPELQTYPIASLATHEVDLTNDKQSYGEETSMRSSESQNEKLQLNDYQEEPEHASMRLDIDNNSDDTTSQFLKSVPELQPYPIASLATHEVDLTNDKQSYGEEASMRSSESQNEKLQLNDYQEKPEHASMTSIIDNNSDDTTSQFLKSVPELQPYPIASLATDKVDLTNDKQPYEEEANMRSSESQNEKLQLNDYQEEPEHASMRLDIDNNSDDTTSQFLKSVPELQPYPIASLATDKVDLTNDKQPYEEEANMRSSESLNEKLQLNDYQEEPEHASMRLDIDNNSDDTTSQFLKSVPELRPYPISSLATHEVDLTNDKQSYGEEASMRSSESENEKLQLNDYQEQPEHASTRLDIDNNFDDTTSQFFKSVPELQPYPIASLATDKVDITNDEQSYGEEASMRSSESQNEKIKTNENKEVHEPWLIGLNIESHPEEPTWQLSKSAPELPFDSKVLMVTEKVDIPNDQHAYKGQAIIRSSGSQNEKLQLNDYQEQPEHASTRLDIDNNFGDTTSQFFKSVPELQPYPIASLATDKVDITNDEQFYREEANMRSSESQNEKIQSNENQERHKPLPMGLDIERQPKESKSQLYKSVSELPYDPLLSTLTEKVDITDDSDPRKVEASVRSSESQNEKLKLNEYQEEPEHSSRRLDIENNSDDAISQFLKSVPELELYPTASLATVKTDVTNDQQSYGEEASMRSSESENEKNQLNKNQDAYGPLVTRLDLINHPEDRKWQFYKSVPELPYDPMVSMSTDNVKITNEQPFLKEGTMRFSQNQNERSQIDNSHRLHEFLPTKLGNENHQEHSTSQLLKSVPELYMTRSNINHVNNENVYFTEDPRLLQNQNERQHIHLNPHSYDSLSSRLDNDKNVEDGLSQVFKSVQGLNIENMQPLAANNAKFSYIQNPTKEQTTMRLSQNRNENKEIQYPSTSLGINNEHMNRKDNSEHVVNDFMDLNVAQHHQLHENTNAILRSSNQWQHLNPNFKSLPEYKMLPTSQFEFNNGQNALNEHVNMRINQQHSRDPESMENQNVYNSLPMRWNAENQHQDLPPKTFNYISDSDHTLLKSNEFDNEQFNPYEVPKLGNNQEYRSRQQLFGDHILDDTQSSRWFQTKQHNDHFANYYKSIPEAYEEYTNPQFRKHLNRVAVNHRLNDVDTFNSHDFPSSRTRLHDHMQKYHQEESSNTDGSMEPSMHMNMREPFVKSSTEFNNMHFNHPHPTARFGAGLPIPGVSSGAVGVFPTANAGCGIPLLLSCSPSVVSGSLARSPIAGPIFKSLNENFKYHIKRDAKDFADIPDVKVQKASLPYNDVTGATSEI